MHRVRREGAMIKRIVFALAVLGVVAGAVAVSVTPAAACQYHES